LDAVPWPIAMAIKSKVLRGSGELIRADFTAADRDTLTFVLLCSSTVGGGKLKGYAH